MVFCFNPGFFWPGFFLPLYLSYTPNLLNMNTYFYCLLFMLSVLIAVSCNPVKRVLNDPAKTQQVVDKYLQDYPVNHDTIITYLPGDTITSMLIGYDTVWQKNPQFPAIFGDTLSIDSFHYVGSGRTLIPGGILFLDSIMQEKQVVKTITKTVTIQGPVKMVQLPPDTKAIEGYKKLLSDKDNDAAVKAEQFKTEQVLVDYWRIRFWILVTATGLLIAAKFYFKL